MNKTSLDLLFLKEWENVFVDNYGSNPDFYPTVAERLRIVTGKYVEHRAWPTKFDGITFEEIWDVSEIPLTWYDDPDFYFEHWEDWGEKGKETGAGDRRKTVYNPPHWADVVEAVMYFSMRGGILQKALQQLDTNTKVISPIQFVKELKGSEETKQDHPQ